MFALIKPQIKKTLKSIKVEAVCHGDVKYYIFYVRNPKKINWTKLASKLGDLKSRVILGEEIKLPKSSSIKLTCCERYAHKLTMHALDEILASNAAFVKDKQATIIDIQCKYQGYSDILVRYFNRVKIITNKIDFYNNYSDSKLYECGATVTITNECTRIDPENILFVSPTGIILPTMENSDMPVISAHNVEFKMKAPVYHSFYEKPPTVLADLLSEHEIENIELSHKIAGALYEFCGIRSLGTRVDTGFVNEERSEFENIKVNIFSIDKNV